MLTADPVLDQAIRASEAADMPQHQVAPNQGKLLQILVQMMGAKNILEIGTLAGYSTIWLGWAVAPESAGRAYVLQMMADEPRLSATAIQTVGSKGYDGFAIAQVLT